MNVILASFAPKGRSENQAFPKKNWKTEKEAMNTKHLQRRNSGETDNDIRENVESDIWKSGSNNVCNLWNLQILQASPRNYENNFGYKRRLRESKFSDSIATAILLRWVSLGFE